MQVKIKTEKRKSVALKMILNEVVLAVPEKVKIDSNEILKNCLKASSKFEDKLISNQEFWQKLNFWQDKIKVRPKRVQIRTMKNNWASCSSKGFLTFNSLLFSMPDYFADYIIIHELLHFKIPRHNKLFRSYLSAYLPDWQDRLKQTVKFLVNK